MERTLIFFKPDAIYRNIVCRIYEEFILSNDFKVVSIKPVTVTRNMILEHYKKNLIHKSSDVVNRVIDFYEGKLILLMVLERENAVSLMRKILGNSDPAESDKSTIRGMFLTMRPRMFGDRSVIIMVILRRNWHMFLDLI